MKIEAWTVRCNTDSREVLEERKPVIKDDDDDVHNNINTSNNSTNKTPSRGK